MNPRKEKGTVSDRLLTAKHRRWSCFDTETASVAITLRDLQEMLYLI